MGQAGRLISVLGNSKLNGFVHFEGDSISAIKQFKESVDDYLETCTEIMKETDNPNSPEE